MFIQEFYTRFISKHERSRLFDAIRQVSRLESQVLLYDDEAVRWPEWPQIGSEDAGMQKA